MTRNGDMTGDEIMTVFGITESRRNGYTAVSGGGIVYRHGRDPVTVKNLGWLLAQDESVARFEVREPRKSEPDCDAVLVAHMMGRGGLKGLDPAVARPPVTGQPVAYVTPFADRSILLDWLTRPKFGGLGLDWFGLPSAVPESKRELHTAQRAGHPLPVTGRVYREAVKL